MAKFAIVPSKKSKAVIDAISLGISTESISGESSADALTRHAKAIRALGRRVVGDAVEIGRQLTAARKLCGHGNWQSWLEREFQWTDDTALNFMNVYKWSEANPERVRDLSLPLRSIYLLAQPSTPESVREEIIERAASGDKISHEQVKQEVAEAKALAKNGKADSPEHGRKPTEEIIARLDDLFSRLDRQAQDRWVRDLFCRLDRQAQASWARMLRNIAMGRG